MVMTAFSQPVQVPLNHRIYEFLDRMQTKGMISPLFGAVPFSRNDVAGALTEIQKKTEENDLNLTRAESQQFEQFKGEFRAGLEEDVPSADRWRERHFLEWSEPDPTLSTDLYFAESLRTTAGDQTATISHTTAGGTLRDRSRTVSVFIYSPAIRCGKAKRSRMNNLIPPWAFQ